jgi:hypothetical protein
MEIHGKLMIFKCHFNAKRKLSLCAEVCTQINIFKIEAESINKYSFHRKV